MEIVAPTFETSRIRFASYGYSPVGVFADKRGNVVPFVDANSDGVLDPQTEATGRCDRRSQKCWIDHARLRMIRSKTDCPLTTGTWLLGNMYNRGGTDLKAALCDDRGNCAGQHEDAFRDVKSVEAIWIPEAPDLPSTLSLSLKTTEETVHYDHVTLPVPIHLVDAREESNGHLEVSVTADQPVDLASLWVMRGDKLQWSSAAQPASFHAQGATLRATVPQAVVDSCQGACEAYLQFAHVWRDDAVLSLSEIKHKFSI